MEDDSAEKEHEPTQKKLDDARERGEVVRSAELATAAGYGGFLLAALGAGTVALTGFGETGMVMLDQADPLSRSILGGGSAMATGMVVRAILPALPFLLLPGGAVLAVLLAQRAITFSPEKLLPRLSRIDPITNAKQKFGREGLFEFAKSTVKLILVSILLLAFLGSRLPVALGAQAVAPAMAASAMARLIIEFLVMVLAISSAMGGIDFLWQHFEHLRRNRMSRQEVLDELKQSEGDPHMRQQRRQRGQAIATNKMMADVPKADVVIVNPTHYAVALRWNRASRRAPVCLAKGVDEVAARIRAAAATAGVPIHPDPVTARALHAGVEIGQEIRPEHYAPVAAAIRFAEKMRRRARERHGR